MIGMGKLDFGYLSLVTKSNALCKIAPQAPGICEKEAEKGVYVLATGDWAVQNVETITTIAAAAAWQHCHTLSEALVWPDSWQSCRRLADFLSSMTWVL